MEEKVEEEIEEEKEEDIRYKLYQYLVAGKGLFTNSTKYLGTIDEAVSIISSSTL